MHDLVEQLLSLETAPVVTITAGMDPRRPGNDADRIRFRNLVATARARLEAMPDDPGARQALERLDGLVAGVDLRAGGHGVVVVAAPDFGDARLVPFPVRDDAAVGHTAATRSLVQGLRRTPRYRILVISDRATRLFEAVRDTAVEVRDHGFPMRAEIVPRDRRGTGGPFALPTGRDDKELWRHFYRQVDAALTEVSRGDELPLVLAGVRNWVGLFLEVSHHESSVVGVVKGARDRLGPSALAALAWPVMQAELERRRAVAVEELTQAAGTAGAVTGMDEVWQLGRAGRGRLLVVEEGYRAEPSAEVGDHLEAAGDGAPGVIEDPVDEIIEHVLRAGGSVEFVADGALAGLGHIGLLLR